jgi:penicillin amidase
MHYLKSIVVSILTLLFIICLDTKFGSIPPIGRFLNPICGFWQNSEKKGQKTSENLILSGLKSSVVIQYDENSIPHIFAENDWDLYFAQGYATARDRLWQMDIQTRTAAGRLAEVIGPKVIDLDRYHRRMGMVFAAEKGLTGILKNPLTRNMVNAYTAGVNSYIHQLTPKDYPLEFKLLDYSPEEWKPINCVYLIKLMSETLAGGSDQFAMTNNLRHFGKTDVGDLFPNYPFHETPIIPTGTKWKFSPLHAPEKPPTYLAALTEHIKTHETPPGIGSNNWAISGEKSASGFPILANDPHLHLSFPSIWYQVQLSSPSVNVNGVSLPGAPCVIIGYNKNISWGVTNVDADVLDWYQIKFKDHTNSEYWYNGRWYPVKKRIEQIKIRGKPSELDTVRYTHHGPVVYEDSTKNPTHSFNNVPIGNALRWIAHDESNDIYCFYLLNRSINYDDYRKALINYTAPAQNFIFASIDKDIAITSNGKFPLKYNEQGKFILNGSDPADDWHGWIPVEQNPSIKNPTRGFVSSANQSPVDHSYPYYINWKYENYFRAKRINDRLTSVKKATIDSMRLMQTDDYSVLAEEVLPTMLRYLDKSKMNTSQIKALRILEKWDKHNSANSIGASIFNSWWQNFYHSVWDDEFQLSDIYLKSPSFDRTEKMLLTEPNLKWFDNINTAQKENCATIINQSYLSTVSGLIKTQGEISMNWGWGKIKPIRIDHMAGLNGFGTGEFASGGAAGVINALNGGIGPSWRMVVQMGPSVSGYGILPGGESGNPGSFFYDDMFNTWKTGQLKELLFLNSASEKSSRIKKTAKLLPFTK